jgi:uncharacterized protein YdhG (YjbR/CyaY superfamily)
MTPSLFVTSTPLALATSWLDYNMKTQISTEAASTMSRGVLVVDENEYSLQIPLINKNFRVLIPRTGASDAEIKETLLPKRVLITRNSKDFIEDAYSYEYGIIATDKIRNLEPQELAKIISRAWIDFKLKSKRHGFILLLQNNGKHTYKELL